MKYNYQKIGDRIRDKRKLLEYSQDEFIDILKNKYEVRIGRNTLSNIENGNLPPEKFTMPLLIAMCEIFDCELGYLLGEYEEEKRNYCISKTSAFLSYPAIEYLEKHGTDLIYENDLNEILREHTEPLDNEQYISSLNTILETFPEIITYIGRFLMQEELNLSTDGFRVRNKEATFNIDEASLNLALQLKTYITKGKKIKSTNIHNSTRHAFALNFIATRLEDLENENKRLFNTLFPRP